MVLGVLYGTAFCWRPHSLLKLIVKTGSTALLALWAYLLGGPVLLVAGLALVVVIGLIVALSIGLFRGSFTKTVPLTVE